jgi:hypothetical protein
MVCSVREQWATRRPPQARRLPTTVNPPQIKVVRVKPIDPAAPMLRFQRGGLYVPAKASWLSDLKAELLAFPTGRHDDIVDALGVAGQLVDKWCAGPQPIDNVVRFRRPERTSRTTSSRANLSATAASAGRRHERLRNQQPMQFQTARQCRARTKSGSPAGHQRRKKGAVDCVRPTCAAPRPKARPF